MDSHGHTVSFEDDCVVAADCCAEGDCALSFGGDASKPRLKVGVPTSIRLVPKLKDLLRVSMLRHCIARFWRQGFAASNS